MVLFPLYTVPCGPIHIVFTITDVSTALSIRMLQVMRTFDPTLYGPNNGKYVNVIFGAGTRIKWNVILYSAI